MYLGVGARPKHRGSHCRAAAPPATCAEWESRALEVRTVRANKCLVGLARRNFNCASRPRLCDRRHNAFRHLARRNAQSFGWSANPETVSLTRALAPPVDEGSDIGCCAPGDYAVEWRHHPFERTPNSRKAVRTFCGGRKSTAARFGGGIPSLLIGILPGHGISVDNNPCHPLVGAAREIFVGNGARPADRLSACDSCWSTSGGVDLGQPVGPS